MWEYAYSDENRLAKTKSDDVGIAEILEACKTRSRNFVVKPVLGSLYGCDS